jgi:integrase
MVWITDMREGSERSFPRADQTVINKVRLAAEFLHALDSSYWTLRQVTRDDCKGWIATRSEDRRYAYQALRTMFRVLKARRQIFANPMRNYSLGTPYRPLLEPVAPHRLATAARAADGDPGLRLILALTAIHAMRALHIMSAQTDDVDLASGRIVVGGQQRPLDAYTRDAVTAWLDYRQERWPRRVNPHLVINQPTCHELGPVSHSWAGNRLLTLGLATTAVRTDRILDEAAACGVDSGRGHAGRAARPWSPRLRRGRCRPCRPVAGRTTGSRSDSQGSPGPRRRCRRGAALRR